MNTTRIRNLIAGGVLAAAAILAAPIAVGQPDNPGDCAAHPGGGACMVMVASTKVVYESDLISSTGVS